MDWKTLFLSADGRISRQSFWIGVLILIGVGVLLGWIPILGWLISLALIYCWVCLYSKRLHDFGKTGWLAAVPFALMFLFIIVGVMSMGSMAAMGAYSGNEDAAAMGGLGVVALFGLLFGLGSLAFLLWVGLTPGEPGPNRYGEPPIESPLPQG